MTRARVSYGLATLVASTALALGYLAYSNGWGPLTSPTERYSATVKPGSVTALTAGDVEVRIPAHATARTRTLTIEVIDAPDDVQFADVHGRRVDIDLPGRLRRRGTLDFALPSDAASDARFFVMTRHEHDSRWRAVGGTRRGGRFTVRTRDFSEWRLASFSPAAIGREVRDVYRVSVDTRVDRPGCSDRDGDGRAEVEPSGDPPVFPCLSRVGEDYDLTLHSNRAVGMTVPIPEGWRHTNTSSPTLGEYGSSVLTDIGEALPGGDEGRGAVLLPATGQVTLRSSGARPAKIRVFADNSGTVLDLLLVAVSKSKDQKVRAAFAKYAKCLFEAVGGVRDLKAKTTIKAIASCLDDAIPLLARVLLVGDVLQVAAANLDAIRGKASGTVRVRFSGADDPGSAPQAPPLVRTPKPPAPDPRREGFPSCNEYNQLPGPEADAVLDELTAVYGNNGGSRSLTRLSVATFCRLNPGRSIAGVYGGGSEGVEPATSVPTCADYLQLGDAHADAVLDLIAIQHNDDSSIGIRRLSAAGFCQLNPGRKVDGIYGGSG
jgi:hypothetical protein